MFAWSHTQSNAISKSAPVSITKDCNPWRAEMKEESLRSILFVMYVLLQILGWITRGFVPVPQLVFCSKILHHFFHLSGVNCFMIPCHTVASSTKEGTHASIHHAALKLAPYALTVLSKANASASSVVKELIVCDPQRSVPGLVICPTLEGLVCCGGCCHGVLCLSWINCSRSEGVVYGFSRFWVQFAHWHTMPCG